MQTVNQSIEIETVLARIAEQAHFGSPAVADVFRHWSDLVLAANGIPDRRTISPLEIPRSLPHIWLCDYEHDSKRFRYRLAGEHVIANSDQPVRGRYLDEITAADAYPRVHAYFLRCVELPAVLHITGRIYAEKERAAVGERIMLPYGEGGHRITGILGATVRQWTDRQGGALSYRSDTRLHTLYHLHDGSTEIETPPVD